MANLTFSLDGAVVKQVELAPGRTTIGRRPDNDVMLDDPTVSGHHAVVAHIDGAIFIEDLGSTNGIWVGGRKVEKQVLTDGERLTLGRYKAVFRAGAAAREPAETGRDAAANPSPATGARTPRLRVLNGAAAGREVPLTNAVTTLGKQGVSVAAIARVAQGCTLAQVEGEGALKLNSVSVGKVPVMLRHHDEIEMGAARLLYLEY